MTGILVQINTSSGGMPKLPRLSPARVTVDGVEGDWQKNRKYHGGPDRAICLFSEELYQSLTEKGVPLLPNGSLGENFTTRGLDLQQLKPGDRLHFGPLDAGVTIEITKVRVPCRNLKKWDADLPELIVGQSGWVCKVVREGSVRAGDPVTAPVPRPRGEDDNERET